MPFIRNLRNVRSLDLACFVRLLEKWKQSILIIICFPIVWCSLYLYPIPIYMYIYTMTFSIIVNGKFLLSALLLLPIRSLLFWFCRILNFQNYETAKHIRMFCVWFSVCIIIGVVVAVIIFLLFLLFSRVTLFVGNWIRSQFSITTLLLQ